MRSAPGLASETSTKNWIYPVNESGHVQVRSDFVKEHFERDYGQYGFVTRFQSGQPDDKWTVTLNVKHVELGDRIWLYYGSADFDMSVVGFGIVAHVNAYKDGSRQIRITWNRDATGKLIRRYEFDDEVRRYIPFVHVFRSIEMYPELITALEKAAGLVADLSATPIAHVLKPVRAMAKPIIHSREHPRALRDTPLRHSAA